MPIGWKRAATACALLLAAAAAALGSGVAADEAPRVEVALFGEALCPYTYVRGGTCRPHHPIIADAPNESRLHLAAGPASSPKRWPRC